MQYKAIMVTGALAFLVTALSGQNFSDALRLSNFTVGGTARSIGAGSAMGAMGSDFSVMSTNPAGLGWYRGSEFVISPGIYNASTTSRLLNDPQARAFEENRANFNLNTFGVVFANANAKRDWRATNFAVGVNRLANFHQDFYFEGASPGSIVDRFKEQVNSEAGFSDFESGLAFDVGALYDLDDDGLFESDFDSAPDSANVFKRQDVFTTGAINEFVFSIAGNYKERLLIGATVGVPIIRYEVSKNYREEDQGPGVEGNVPFFNALSYNEDLSTSGTGINLKLGAIFRANQMLRLGAAVHTPTFMRLDDVYTASMGYNYTENGVEENFTSESPDGSFEYRLQTPWRFIGSAGVIINSGELRPAEQGDLMVRVPKGGFISAEIEYLDYGNNEFRYDDFGDAERAVNATIADELTSAWNLRLGGEFAYEIFRLRAGYSLQQSPLQGDDAINSTISAGFGIHRKTFFIDMAYRRRMNETFYTPYLTALAPEQLVSQDANLGQIVLTIGFRWF